MSIDLTIIPRSKDLGGFFVRRILPYAKRRMVGPFVFLDHMGPAEFPAGQGIDVRPHPHIGLATVTYLFEGEILHRDTLGSVQAIRPGDVNWMTAGRGIAHSERTGGSERNKPHRLHGLQSWVALPKAQEECAPEFFHHPAATLPMVEREGMRLHVIAGDAYGVQSPVKLYSPLFYVAATLQPGARLALPEGYTERAAYLVEGEVSVDGSALAPQSMAVFHPKEEAVLVATSAARVMLLGGEPFPEPRFIDWNFVSSSQARLEQARADWKEGRFPKIPGDAVEFIPLPEAPKPGTAL